MKCLDQEKRRKMPSPSNIQGTVIEFSLTGRTVCFRTEPGWRLMVIGFFGVFATFSLILALASHVDPIGVSLVTFFLILTWLATYQGQITLDIDKGELVKVRKWLFVKQARNEPLAGFRAMRINRSRCVTQPVGRREFRTWSLVRNDGNLLKLGDHTAFDIAGLEQESVEVSLRLVALIGLPLEETTSEYLG